MEKLNPLFTTETTFTYENLKKMSAVVRRADRLRILLSMMVIYIILGLFVYWYMDKTFSYFIFATSLFLPFVSIWGMNRKVKKYYEQNKNIQNAVVRYEFFEDFLTLHGKNSASKFAYSDLYQMIITQGEIYILQAYNQAFILERAKCSPELVEFLKEKSRLFTNKKKKLVVRG